jgi:hypothetical protein
MKTFLLTFGNVAVKKMLQTKAGLRKQGSRADMHE